MGKKILILDDDQEVHKLLAAYLADMENELFFAENGEEGFAIYHEQKPDLIVTDTNMPVMDGVQFLRKVRELDKEVGIIIFFSYYGKNKLINISDLIKLGASVVMPKDQTIFRLKQEIEALLK